MTGYVCTCSDYTRHAKEVGSDSEKIQDLADRTIKLGRDWRAGKVVNIGPAITAIYQELEKIATDLAEKEERRALVSP